ncbi:MAG: LysE family translocator [candidate division Zixibacteria bacterium]|nr:LysE family translocator [candidate division Zixibacteria bacterium]
MFDTASLLIFAGANFVVLITPGPAVLYTLSRTIDQGRNAGLLSVYGLALGTLPHALAVAFGVAGILASSILAFSVLKYLGAAYLIYLGISRLRRKKVAPVTNTGRLKVGKAAFIESFVVGVLNPKAVLFFLAFLPQFIDPSRGNPVIQTLALWFLSQVMAVVVGSVYALAASWFHRLFFKSGGQSRKGDYLAGSIYIGLGLAAALSGSRWK